MSQPPYPSYPPPPDQPYGAQYGPPYGAQYGAPYGAPTQNPPGPVPLIRPYYGASFGVAVARFFQKYATFSGRASKSEFWWSYLATTLAVMLWALLAVVAVFVGADPDADPDTLPAGFIVVLVVGVLAGLALVVPSFAVRIRRLHDANLSGWMVLLGMIPYVGWIIEIIMMLQPTKPEGARFDVDAVPMGYGGYPPPGYGYPPAGYAPPPVGPLPTTPSSPPTYPAPPQPPASGDERT